MSTGPRSAALFAPSVSWFEKEFGAKYPKAVEKITKDRESLLVFFDFPVEHWTHLRTTDVIESVFATVRLRQRVTKGAGSRNEAQLMARKLKRWVNNRPEVSMRRV